MICGNPFFSKTHGILLPCGYCYNCKLKRMQGWIIRLKEELKVSKTAYFITFTYDTDNVPIIINPKPMTLRKRHMQLFFKKLRKKQKDKIKYYLVGEYGENKSRPHYHAIIFNLQLESLLCTKDIFKIQNYPQIFMNGKQHLNSNIWDYGVITIGTVSPASIAYTVEYIHKNKVIPQFKNDNREKEFSLMSKGLGESYIKKSYWHKDDLLNRYYYPDEEYKVTLPRYYKLKMYDEEERMLINCVQKERADNQKDKERKLKNYSIAEQKEKEFAEMLYVRNRKYKTKKS